MKKVREQLISFVDFAYNTPDPNPYHDSLWWTGDLPAAPHLYPLSASIPLVELVPLARVVVAYIERLVHAARSYQWAQEYLNKLMQQQYADLYAYLHINVEELWKTR